MEQNSSIIRPLINFVKSVVTEIGLFTDAKSYKDEIARYEGGLPGNTRHVNEPQINIEAAEQEAATS